MRVAFKPVSHTSVALCVLFALTGCATESQPSAPPEPVPEPVAQPPSASVDGSPSEQARPDLAQLQEQTHDPNPNAEVKPETRSDSTDEADTQPNENLQNDPEPVAADETQHASVQVACEGLSAQWVHADDDAWSWSVPPYVAPANRWGAATYSMAAGPDGSLFVADSRTATCGPCPTGSSCDGGNGCVNETMRHAILTKYDAEGNVVWSQRIYEGLQLRTADASGGVYAIARWRSYRTDTDYAGLYRYGDPGIARVLIGSLTLDATVALASDPAGNLAYAIDQQMTDGTNASLLRYQSQDGSRHWEQTLPFRTAALSASPDGSFYVVGRGGTAPAQGADLLSLLEFDSEGHSRLLLEEQRNVAWAAVDAGGRLFAIDTDRTHLRVCAEQSDAAMGCHDELAPAGTELTHALIAGGNALIGLRAADRASDELLFIDYADDLAHQPVLCISDSLASAVSAQAQLYVRHSGSIASFAVPSLLGTTP